MDGKEYSCNSTSLFGLYRAFVSVQVGTVSFPGLKSGSVVNIIPHTF